MKLTSALVVIALTATASPSTATKVWFKNSCKDNIDLWDNDRIVCIPPGTEHYRDLGGNFHGMFRHGKNPQATLAEIAVDHLGAWFDISIIPTGPRSGPELCRPLAACKALTGGTGFNRPMQIIPHSNIGKGSCRVITCMGDWCEEAYQFPKDDIKTHQCPVGTDFDVVFCPGGPGGNTPAPTTPKPTTPAPTTPAPTTPTPTTPAPTNATEERSIDGLLESGVTDHSGSSANTVETPVPTTEPVVTETATPVGTTAAPAVEANTQAGASTGSGITGTLVVVFGALAAVAGVAMIVVIRRKKAALDAMEDKTHDSIALRTSTAAL